jgi:hypothetical protein
MSGRTFTDGSLDYRTEISARKAVEREGRAQVNKWVSVRIAAPTNPESYKFLLVGAADAPVVRACAETAGNDRVALRWRHRSGPAEQFLD